MYAFSYCCSLTSVTIGNSVTSIGEYAFLKCSGVTYVIIGSSVKFIADDAFLECTSLTSVHILDLAAWCNIDFDVYGSGNPLRVAHHLFYKGNEVKNLVIPEGVTSIRAYAFDGCSSLTSITIPNSVTSIGNDAFSWCENLKTISIGYGIKSIKIRAFGSPELTDVYCYAEEVPSTDSWAFSGKPKKSTLHVPASSIDLYKLTTPWADFGNIVSLWSGDYIEIPHDEVTLTANSYSRAYGEANPTFGYTVTEGTITSGTPTISCEATATSPVGTYDIVIAKGTVSNNTVSLVKGTLTITKAPLTVSAGNYTKVLGEENPTFTPTYSGFKNGETAAVLTKQPVITTTATKTSTAGTYPVTVSGAEAQNYSFNYQNGTLTVTSQSVVQKDNIQFADAKVKAICVANWDTDHDGELSKQEAAAVMSIGTVFSDEWEITRFDELQYFTGLTAIDDNAFAGCDGLTSITLPNTVTSLGTYAFSGCDGLTSFVIPSSVTTLNDAVFNYCASLTSIIIPKSVTRMGFNPLNGCSALTSIQVESGNPNFDSRNGCNAIIYGKSGILVSGCKNTVIPDGIKTIWQYAFGGCEELTSITIPASVTTFGNYAFFGCDNLEEIHSEIVQPSAINATVFGNTDIFTTATLYVPAGTKAQYQATDGWKDFRNIVEQGGTATDIASATITIENTSYPYTGSAIEPAVSVVYSGTTLVKGTDYSLSYKNNIMAGTATVTATGSGNYTGTVTATFTIDKAQLVVTAQSIMREYGEENPGFTCKISGFMNEDTVLDLTKLPVITTTATSMSSAGTYDIIVSGGEAQNYEFNYVAGTLTIVPKDIAAATVTVADSCAYTGLSVCPDVTVQLDGRVLTKGTDYILTFTNNVMPGIASLTIMGAGNYTGIVTKTFVIFNPQPTVDDLLPDEGDNNGASDYSSGESGVNESTDLNEKVVGNVYYCITPDAGGYDAEEGCLVINKAATTVSTELPAVDGQLPSVSNGFRGLVFFVNAGRGKVKIKAETTGNLLLCVKIAGELVMSMAVEGKTTLTIPYDVSQPSEVLVYAGFAAGSRGTAPSTTEDALKIYSLEWESEPTAIGVDKIENGKFLRPFGSKRPEVERKIENYYDLNGRKVNGQLKKGVYIVGGKKRVVK